MTTLPSSILEKKKKTADAVNKTVLHCTNGAVVCNKAGLHSIETLITLVTSIFVEDVTTGGRNRLVLKSNEALKSIILDNLESFNNTPLGKEIAVNLIGEFEEKNLTKSDIN